MIFKVVFDLRGEWKLLYHYYTDSSVCLSKTAHEWVGVFLCIKTVHMREALSVARKIWLFNLITTARLRAMKREMIVMICSFALHICVCVFSLWCDSRCAGVGPC